MTVRRHFSRALAAFGLVVMLSSPSTAQQVSRADPRARFAVEIGDAKAAMLIDPEVARIKAKAAEVHAAEIAVSRTRQLAIAEAEWLQAEAGLRTNAIKAAVPAVRRAAALVGRYAPGSKLYADVLLTHGGIAAAEGQVGIALRDYQQAFLAYRALKETRSQAIALIFIASLYIEANDQSTALGYYDQAVSIYKSDANLLISIYNNKAIALQQLKRFDESAEQYLKALELARAARSVVLQVQIQNNLARVRLEAGHIDAADRAIAEGMRVAGGSDAGGWRRQLIATAAQSALQRGRKAQAKTLVTRAFASLDTATTPFSLRDAHMTAYATYQATHDDRLALQHLQAVTRLEENATKVAINANIALMGARFNFANQELRIAQLKQDELQRSVDFEQARARTQRYVFMGSAAAVAVIIGMLVFALVTSRRSRDQVRAANDDLAVTNSALGKALAAKTEFLATTSHEIRTPLNGILGMTQVMLADPTLAPALRDRLGVVHGAGVTMRALVDDILDVAKMETGNLTIEAAPFDLCATVTDATRMWEDQARAKGLTFAVDLGACPTMIVGDAARVRQIVFNLLSNALKFTAAGRVALVVRGEGDRLRVAVSDSGIGIPSDKLEQIFESFRQADAGTTRQFGGTGLGLSICRNLARAMGGDVTVTSVEGEGATFTLMLPLELAAAVAKRDPAENEGAGAATLIVDRNPITRSMFRTLLASHTEVVLFAGSADEAVARLAEGGIAHVLIDDATVRLGGDAIAALRAIAATTAETTLLWPVSAAAERDELLSTGVTRVVARPVSGAALVAAMFDKKVAKNNAIPDLVSQAA